MNPGRKWCPASRARFIVPGISCLAVSLIALVAPAAGQASVTRPAAPHSAPAARHAAPAVPECGTYQCFNQASDFLQSVPAPRPGQAATVPLAARVIGPARGAPSMLVGFDNGSRAFWAVSDGYAQGRSGLIGGVSAGNVLNFDHWQYVDGLYYYLHATVSVPPTQWVNAAHRNGIPVLGTVTGDCDGCGPQAVKLFNAANYRRTVAKLYDYAVAYGFDGWVIDMEREFQPTSTVLAAVRELAALRLPDGQPLRVYVYLAGEYSLSPHTAQQRGLLPYFKAGASWQADYNSSPPPPAYPALTFRTLRKVGLRSQRLRAYWSSYVYQYESGCTGGHISTTTQIWNGNRLGGGSCLDTQNLFGNQRTIVPVAPAKPGTPAFYTSTGLFAPEWTYFGNLPDPRPGQIAVGPVSRRLVHAADDDLWVGHGVTYSGRSCTREGTANGVAALITPRSVVGSLPFVTNFNEGEGGSYAVQGTVIENQSWNNLSVQDVPPTWYCTLSGHLTASPVYPAAGSAGAFNGGSALRLTGSGGGEVALFQTRIQLPATQPVVLAFTSRTVSGALPYVRVAFSNGTSQVVRRTVHGPGWQQVTRQLRGRGATITGISVGIPVGRVPVRTVFGQLRLYVAGTDVRPVAITASPVGQVLSWSVPSTQPIAYWNVYQQAGRCLSFLGPAFTTSYDLTEPMFGAAEVTGGTGVRGAAPRGGQFVVQPVSATGTSAVIGRICTTES